jgi:hypothetical protein
MIKKGVLNYSKSNSWCLVVLFKGAINIRSGFYIMRELRGRMLLHVILCLLWNDKNNEQYLSRNYDKVI